MHRHLGLLTGLPTTAVKVAAVGTAVSAVALHNRDRLPRLRWNSTIIEALSGAAGEVAQIALVYPLDTIKVRCQAAGLGSRQVVAQLWAATQGQWPVFLAALYAGAVPAAALSILVGATHYCCFCATRRALVSLTSGGGEASKQADGAAAGPSTSRQQEQHDHDQHQHQQQQQQQHGQHVFVSHGITGTHFLPVDDATSCQHEAAAQAAGQQAPLLATRGETTPAGCSSSGHGGRDRSSAADATSKQQQQQQQEEDSVPVSQQVAEGSLLVNCASAVVTAAMTAVVEAPLELFRHNSQAGQIQGSFLREMWRVLRTSGPRSLYHGWIPYICEACPYDFSELLVVGIAKDVRRHPAVRHMAPAAYDLAVGGLAGTVAVLVSMPFDTVKTYIQTHGAIGTPAAAAALAAAAGGSSGVGASGGAGAFWQTGKALVARGGPGALFVGLAPRLAHQVPGAMVCWFVIESTHRVLSEVWLTDRKAGREAQPAVVQ